MQATLINITQNGKGATAQLHQQRVKQREDPHDPVATKIAQGATLLFLQHLHCHSNHILGVPSNIMVDCCLVVVFDVLSSCVNNPDVHFINIHSCLDCLGVCGGHSHCTEVCTNLSGKPTPKAPWNTHARTHARTHHTMSYCKQRSASCFQRFWELRFNRFGLGCACMSY
eukprot:6463133-Amphidinium_carterae.1